MGLGNIKSVFTFLFITVLLKSHCDGAEIFLQNAATQEILELTGNPSAGGALIRGVTMPSVFKRSHLWNTDWDKLVSVGIGILSSIPDQPRELALDEDTGTHLVASWGYFANSANQEWIITAQTNERYIIVNKATGRCLTCPRSSQARTVNCNAADLSQLWIINFRQTIRNIANSQYLDVNGANVAPNVGAIINTQSWSGLKSQVWAFSYGEALGSKSEFTAGVQGLSVTLVIDEDQSAHTLATWGGRRNMDYQAWYLRKINSQRNFQIVNAASNRCIRSQGSSQAITVACNAGDTYQLWDINYIVPQGPKIWQKYTLRPTQDLTKTFEDRDLIIYKSPTVSNSITWINQYFGDAWRYVKRIYGDSGIDKLYLIFNSPGGLGLAASWCSMPEGYVRSNIDLSVLNWAESTSNYNKDMPIHEMSHIVEDSFQGFCSSPGAGVWKDSMFAEIFIYDVYVGLGWTTESNRVFQEFTNNPASFPTVGRQNYWFRDWFYPIWNKYGKSNVLLNFFKLTAQYWPKIGNHFNGDMNVGQFVHFYSGAAGANLKEQANTAFGWSSEYESQFQKAKLEFPYIQY